MDTRADRIRTIALVATAVTFTVAFVAIVVPPLVSRQHGDVIAALGDGFTNPFAAGYSLDIFCCWAVLAIWVVHEAYALRVRRGWIALVAGVVPGVTAGFVAYLLIRRSQVTTSARAPSA